MKGHSVAKCKLMRFLFSEGVYQWLPKCNQGFTYPQRPNEDWVPIVTY